MNGDKLEFPGDTLNYFLEHTTIREMIDKDGYMLLKHRPKIRQLFQKWGKRGLNEYVDQDTLGGYTHGVGYIPHDMYEAGDREELPVFTRGRSVKPGDIELLKLESKRYVSEEPRLGISPSEFSI